MKISGILVGIIPDVRNVNGRIYPESILRGMIAEYNKKIESKKAFGQLIQETFPTYISLDKVSHRITSLGIEGNQVNVEAELLDTPQGLLAQSIISSTTSQKFYSQTTASLSEDHVVQDDAKIEAIDLDIQPTENLPHE